MRLIPRSFAIRLSLLVIAGFIAVTALFWFAIGKDRWQEGTEIFATSTADRVVAITALLNDVETSREYEQLITAISHPGFRVLLPRRLPQQLGPHQNNTASRENKSPHGLAGLLHRQTQKRLRERGMRSFRVLTGDVGHQFNKTGGKLAKHRQLVVSTQLDNQLWATFITRVPFLDRHQRPPFGWILLGLGLLVFSIWMTHRLSRPLSQLAKAADRFGVDVNAPAVNVSGPREVRQAAQAFNLMQERLRRFVADRTQMLAAISHDLRTILTRMKLRSELLEDDTQRAKMQSDIDEMNAMLEATLLFARDDAHVESSAVMDISVLLSELCDDLSETGQKLNFSAAESIHCRVQSVSLRRAFSNVIQNALRYGGEASVRLVKKEKQLLITIADRGPGIPIDQQEQVFSPFYRVEPSRNRETGGTGLGLTIARTIIRRHGGDIQLSNREGGGLLVSITLPFEELY